MAEDYEESAYEIFGRRLGELVSERERLKGSKEKKAAQKKIDTFLVQIGATRPQARPNVGPPEDIMMKLFHTGRLLIEACWQSLDQRPSTRTKEFLTECGVDDEATQQAWAVRLALPVLSCREISALRDQIKKDRTWAGGADLHPTARRFTVWLLAHRLALSAEAVATKVGAGSDWDAFKDLPNPI